MTSAFLEKHDSIDSQRSRKRQHSDDVDLSDDDIISTPSVEEDRRAHHNELERRRRDHIKDHFMTLKGAIPLLDGEKSSRALILKRAVEYISILQSKLNENQMHVEQLKRRNEQLEAKLCQREQLVVDPMISLQSSQISQIATTSASRPILSLLPLSTAMPTIPVPTSPPSIPALPGLSFNNLSPSDLLQLTQAILATSSTSTLPQSSPPFPSPISAPFSSTPLFSPNLQILSLNEPNFSTNRAMTVPY